MLSLIAATNLLVSLSELVRAMQVPQYFEEDLFSLLGNDQRPDYRWLIMVRALVQPHSNDALLPKA